MKVKPLNWKTDKYGFTEANGVDGYYCFKSNRLDFIQGDHYGRLDIDGDFKEAAQKHHNNRVQVDFDEWVESEAGGSHFRIGQLEGAIETALPYFEEMVYMADLSPSPPHDQDKIDDARQVIANLKKLIGETE